MVVTVDTVLRLAGLLTACGSLAGAVVSVYKLLESVRRQSAAIKAIEAEQTVICFGLKGALEGLIEQGCDGPCKAALEKLNRHLNEAAHETRPA